VDEPALERQQSPERRNGVRSGFLLELRDEAELAGNDLQH
jgi:hypothetical protein